MHQNLALKITEVAFGLPAYGLIMAWHPLKENSPADIWLRGLILEISQEIDADTAEISLSS